MANITVKKGLIGQEDINLGTGTFSRAKSDGSAQTITKVNAEQLITLPAGTRTVSTVTDYLANAAVHNVKDYGAVGDGVTDDATAIQAAMDAAAAPVFPGTEQVGDVYFPPGDYGIGTTLIQAHGVHLLGALMPSCRGMVRKIPRLTALAAITWMIDTTLDRLALNGDTELGIQGLHFEGYGVGGGGGGVRWQFVRSSTISHCTFDGFDNQAILQEAGGTTSFIGNFAQNCLLDTTRSAVAGVLQLTSADSWIIGGEYTASLLSAESDSNQYLAAVAIVGLSSNHFVTNVVGEISDVGFHVEGSAHKFVGCRADINRGPGYRIATQHSLYTGCHSYRDGQETDDTFGGFHIAQGFAAAGPSSNVLTGCTAQSSTADSNRLANAFIDATTGESAQNVFTGCKGYGLRQQTFSMNATSGGAVNIPTGPLKVFGASDTTPSVDNYGSFRWFSPDIMTITDFDDGVSGQIISFLHHGGNTVTIQENANIATSAGSDLTVVALTVYQFLNHLGKWYQV
jgi:hypothetical protein